MVFVCRYIYVVGVNGGSNCNYQYIYESWWRVVGVLCVGVGVWVERRE